VYLDTEQKIQALTTKRDALAAAMKNALHGSNWDDQSAKALIRQGVELLAQARALAGS
jgi:hypothetical protein